MTDSKGIELPSQSQNSEIREQSMYNVGQNPSQPLAHPPQPPPQRSWLKAKNIMKGLILVFLFMMLASLASSFLPKTGIHPQPLTSLTDIKEIVAPDEVDYRAYYYYKIMERIALQNVEGNLNFTGTEKEMDPFSSITFSELFNVFKVIRTIQLANDYSTSKQEHEQDYKPPDIDLNTPVNYTDDFQPPVDQFRCAACYSFPVTATIQYQYRVKLGKKVKLSQQQLIDCSKQNPEENGCHDGNITKTFQYARKKGLVSNNDYPYRSIAGQSFSCQDSSFKDQQRYYISDFIQLPKGQCQAIQAQLVKGNVVASMIEAEQLSSYNPVSGRPFTNCKRSGFNHAITIVGQTSKGEWIVRNSWGENWGNKGYFTMGRGNTCGVCEFAFVPVLNLDENNQVIRYNQSD